MKKFINLLADELYRSRIFYGIVIGLVIVSQLVMVGLLIIGNRQSESNYPLNLASLIDYNGIYHVLLIAAFLLFFAYSAFTWFREWSGDSSFIIRLMTLPGNRFTIVLAKLASVFLMMGGVMFTQLCMIFLINCFAGILLGDGAYSALPIAYAYAQTLSTTYFVMPMSVASAALIYGGLLWIVLGIFLVVVTYMQSYQESYVKAFGKVVLLLIANGAWLVGMIIVVESMNLVASEIFTVFLVFILVGIVLNLAQLARRINVKPRKHVTNHKEETV